MIAFWILATIVVASAVWTIAASKPVYSVVALLLNFAALAIMYVTLSAEFLAVIQIIVYSGAILVLFVFVIALLSSGTSPFAMGPNRLPNIWLPGRRSSLASLGFLVFAIAHAPTATPPADAERSDRPASSAASPISAKRSLRCSCCPSR